MVAESTSAGEDSALMRNREQFVDLRDGVRVLKLVKRLEDDEDDDDDDECMMDGNDESLRV